MTLRRIGWLAKQLLLALRGNRTGAAQEFQFSPPHPDPDPPSHLDLLRRGIGQWNAWRAQHPALQPDLGGVNLQGVNLCGANLSDANLQGADLSGSRLSGVNLCGAHLEGANLSRAYLAGQRAETVELPPANLRRAFFDYATNLEGIVFGDATGGAVLLADVHWNNVNLTVVDWSSLTVIGDDREADRCKHISSYRRAARANHQLSVALQDQGLAKEATSFAYQARVRQRQVLRLQALMRPASSPQQRWLVHLLHLWWHNPRFWLGLALAFPVLLLLLSLLFSLDYQSLIIEGTVYLLLAFLGLAVLWLTLPPIHKLVFSLLILTFVFPLLALLVLLALLLGLLTLLVGWVLSPPNLFVAAIGVLTNGALLVIWLWQLSPRWLLPIRKQLLPRLEGYRSFYPLLKKTLPDYGWFVFYGFLDMLAGYGYKPWKSVICYLGVIVSFAMFYLLVGYADGVAAALAAHRSVVVPLLTPLEAFVYSIISFHGRGFFPGGGIGLGDLLVVGAACEAVVGLVIEVSFIATFTQRFLGR